MSDQTPAGACWLRLANGWTVSVSEDDTPPALCSVAAWPTCLDGARLSTSEWFPWDGGRIECRCYTLGDVRVALARVAAACPP